MLPASQQRSLSRGGDTAVCQNTLDNCFFFCFWLQGAQLTSSLDQLVDGRRYE